MIMHRKSIVLLGFIAAVILSACSKPKGDGRNTDGQPPKVSGTQKDKKSSSENTGKFAGEMDPNDSFSDDGSDKPRHDSVNDIDYYPLAADNFKKIGDCVSYQDNQGNAFEFTVKSVEYGKQSQNRKFGQMEKDSLDAYGVKYDTQWNILNEYSYIWMKVDVKALKEGEKWNPLQFLIVTLNKDRTLYQDIGPYLFYFDGIEQTEDHAKDIFSKEFQKGVTTEVTLGFFTSDRVLDKKLGYYISQNSPDAPGKKDSVVLLN